MTAPVMSVIETMVLLNVAEMWAMPVKIFLLPLALTILGFSMSFGSSDRLVEIWSAGFTSAAGLAPFFSPAGFFSAFGAFSAGAAVAVAAAGAVAAAAGAAGAAAAAFGAAEVVTSFLGAA